MWRTTYDSRSPFYEASKKLLKAFNSISLPVPIPPPQSPPPWPLETCSCQRRVPPPLLLSHSLDHDSDKANLIIRLDSSLGDFLVPRGHYSIEMYDKYMKLSGPTYTHKVPYPSTLVSLIGRYSTIDNVYLLPMSDDVHSAVILCLNRPQKQGNQNIRFLILQTSFEESTIEFELEEQEMESRYHGKLHKEENGQMYRLVAKLFKYVAGMYKNRSLDLF